MRQFKIAAQHLTEFALCLTVVIVTLVGMQLYVKRSLQARYKEGVGYLFSQIKQKAEEVGASGTTNTEHLANIRTQYIPYYFESDMTELRGENIPARGTPNIDMQNKIDGALAHTVDIEVSRSGYQKVTPEDGAD